MLCSIILKKRSYQGQIVKIKLGKLVNLENEVHANEHRGGNRYKIEDTGRVVAYLSFF